MAGVGKRWPSLGGREWRRRRETRSGGDESQCSQRPHGTRALPRTPFTCPRPRNHAVATNSLVRSTVHGVVFLASSPAQGSSSLSSLARPKSNTADPRALRRPPALPPPGIRSILQMLRPLYCAIGHPYVHRHHTALYTVHSIGRSAILPDRTHQHGIILYIRYIYTGRPRAPPRKPTPY